LASRASQDRLSRQNNWDVALQVGVHQQVSPLADGPQPYGAVSVSYNLGSRVIDRHLDRAVAAYGDWKKVQEGDAARNAEILQQQIVDTIATDEARLKSLDGQMKEINDNLAAVTSPDTSAAFDFSNQLTASRLLLRIETGDAAYRIASLRDYLAKTF
jgi:hypothetical protein